MCGIAGIIKFTPAPIDRTALHKMMAQMPHRGPDDWGVFVEKNVGLAFVRLSIIDLSAAGHQPMFSADQRYVMVFNGEIYNYIELREELSQLGYTFRTKTDSEVLLTAYRAWGKDMLSRLNGMFSFAIFDRQAQILFAVRDRFGIKPFYYHVSRDALFFASEIPPILEVLPHHATPDQGTLFNFITFNRTDQSERTFFQEVKQLPHGHYIELNTNLDSPDHCRTLTPKRWYHLRNELKPAFAHPQAFRQAFSASVGLRLRSDVPVGVSLSGGLDSSSIVSTVLHDYQKKDLHTFSAVYGAGQFGDESEFIKLYEQQLSQMYYTVPDADSLYRDLDTFVRAHAEPVPSTSPYAQYKVMELAKDHITVSLDGQGADEALAGYHYFFGFHFKNLLLQGKVKTLVAEMRHYLQKHSGLYGIKAFAFLMLPTALRTRFRVMEKGYLKKDFYQAHAHESIIAGELYGARSLREALLSHFEYKLEHLLKWEDRNSMCFSLEARVPFLDHHLVEKTLSLADDQIIHEGMTKHILREAMKGLLPEPIRMRRDKVGFGTPQDEWFRTPQFKTYIQDLIESDLFRSRNLVDVKAVKNIFQQHQERKGNHAKEIWKWIHLENWHRQFID